MIKKYFAGDPCLSFLCTQMYRFVFVAEDSFLSHMNDCNRGLFCGYLSRFSVEKVHRHFLSIMWKINNHKQDSIRFFGFYRTSIYESNISVKFMCMANKSNQSSTQLFESFKEDYLPLSISIYDHNRNAQVAI